jgi:hypothetical protein
VASWTVIRQSFLPGFAADVPFLPVDVELPEQAGLRMIGRLLDGPGAPVAIGAPVRVAFEDIAAEGTGTADPGGGFSVPAFTLAGS